MEIIIAVYLFVGGFYGAFVCVTMVRSLPRARMNDEDTVWLGLKLLAGMLLIAAGWPVILLAGLVGSLATRYINKRR
jgi:hypothetical protein